MVSIAIIGIGAVGSLLAYMAKEHKPTVIYRSEIYGEAIDCYGGIVVQVNQEDHVVEVEHYLTGKAPANSYDYVFIAVKAHDTADAVKEALRIVKDNGIVVLVQNGIGGLELAEKVIGENKPDVGVAGGVLTYGVLRERAGIARITGIGELIIGYKGRKADERLMKIKDILNGNIRIVDDIGPYRWLKLIVNAAINPVTALLNASNRVIIELEEAWIITKMIVKEALNVIKKLGIELPVEDVLGYVWEVAYKTADNISSMAQDIRSGRKTEIEYINGAIARIARENNIDAPVNTLLTLLVRGVEKWRGK
ncbi:MAG TPA: ketopantoate reductase family protein [Desulfurococcaceae archaeon]|nr:ketopantoate reductase family protein [Desulfurococcaceae archaeon]